jgi:hypothetical protein
MTPPSNTETKVYTLDDFQFFWTPYGVPCFIGLESTADGYDLCDLIEEDLGFSTYYMITDVISHKEITTNIPGHYLQEPNSKSQKWVAQSTKKEIIEERSPSIIKVTKNLVGRVVSPCTDPFGPEYFGVETQALYSLPPIPMSLVNKMDEFFRLVHAQHGTESILLLTFDDANPNSSDSWGILVPKQENTSVHCKYDPDSVAELKPFHLSIVGSVHSHPEMAAYASGTDHEDQADFDGLHITYGWQKTVNNGATQYYAEMQMSGTAYKLNIDDVFETIKVINEPDPEVVEWTKNVIKKVQPLYTGGTHQTTTPTTIPPLKINPQSSTTITPTTGLGHKVFELKHAKTEEYREELLVKVPNFDLPFTAALVVEVDSKDPHCPLCEVMLDNAELYDDHYCSNCGVYLATQFDNVANIVEFVLNVETLNNTINDLSDIYLLCLDANADNVFMHIYDNSFASTDTLSKNEEPYLYDDFDTAYYANQNYRYTLCCGSAIDLNTGSTECECIHRVTFEDMLQFETVHPNSNVYEDHSVCYDCTHYLQPACPGYRNMIIEWTKTYETPQDQSISICESFVQIENYSTYSYERD